MSVDSFLSIVCLAIDIISENGGKRSFYVYIPRNKGFLEKNKGSFDTTFL